MSLFECFQFYAFTCFLEVICCRYDPDNTWIIISNQVTEVTMTLPIGSVTMCTAVTTDDNVSSQVTEAKMTMHKGFLNFCTAVTTDENISSQVTESELTVHNEFLNLCMTCASVPCKREFPSFNVFMMKQNTQ